MTPDEIKQLLKEKGLTQADLMRRWGCPACTVSALINRKFTSARYERRLARALGIKLEHLRQECAVNNAASHSQQAS